jgi:hypothetical protein
MGLVREPLDVDFVVDPKSLTQQEKEAVSQYIREYKAKQAIIRLLMAVMLFCQRNNNTNKMLI